MNKMIPSLIFCFIVGTVLAAEEESRSTYIKTRENKRLHGYVNKRIDSTDEMSCSQACLRYSWCTSSNFKDSSGNCELNKHEFPPADDGAKLTDDRGTTFSMFLKGCLMAGCLNGGTCLFDEGKDAFACSCSSQWRGEKCEMVKAASCSVIKKYVSSVSGNYVIDPDGEGGLAPFTVFCDMTDKSGVGVTVISHDSENRTHVDGCENYGCYSRDIHYTGASLSQLASLTRVSSRCQQFIKYECYGSVIFRWAHAWWVSRDSAKMTYWGGASPGSGKCACGMTNSCADSRYGCNCDKNDNVWREDSGLLTDKTKLPVKQLMFSDVSSGEEGYHTLGKLKCFGIE